MILFSHYYIPYVNKNNYSVYQGRKTMISEVCLIFRYLTNYGTYFMPLLWDRISIVNIIILLTIVGQKIGEDYMIKKICYGIHTVVLKHTISRKEAMQIKRLLGKAPGEKIYRDTSYFVYGINELTIKEYSYPSQDKNKNIGNNQKYKLELVVNCSRALGKNGNLVLDLTDRNIKKLQMTLNNLLRQVLKLGENNNDIAIWTFDRLDDAFDIYLDIDPGNYIYLLNESLYLPSKKKFKVYQEADLFIGSERARESVYFGNGSYTLNIYDKWNEQKKKNPNTPQTDITYGLLRVERQSKQQYIKSFLPERSFMNLFDKRNIDTMRQSLLDILKTCFGIGDYFEDSLIYHAFSDEYGDVDKQDEFLFDNNVVNGGRLQTHRNLDPNLLKKFNSIGIAPAYIDFCTNNFRNISDCNGNKYAWYPSLYTIICSAFPDVYIRKQYNLFSVPYKDQKNNRYKVHFIVHDSYSCKGNNYYCSGKTFNICQERMFEKLKEIYNTVSSDITLSYMVTDDIQRFLQTIKDNSLKQEVKQYLQSLTSTI